MMEQIRFKPCIQISASILCRFGFVGQLFIPFLLVVKFEQELGFRRFEY